MELFFYWKFEFRLNPRGKRERAFWVSAFQDERVTTRGNVEGREDMIKSELLPRDYMTSRDFWNRESLGQMRQMMLKEKVRASRASERDTASASFLVSLVSLISLFSCAISPFLIVSRQSDWARECVDWRESGLLSSSDWRGSGVHAHTTTRVRVNNGRSHDSSRFCVCLASDSVSIPPFPPPSVGSNTSGEGSRRIMNRKDDGLWEC